MRDPSLPVRRGLVLGGGGVLGAAWTAGALRALEERLGMDARDFDHVLGTSAGAVFAALIGSGVPASDLLQHQLGQPLVSGPFVGFVWDYDTATGPERPPRPKPGLGSSTMLRSRARQLRHLPPTAVLAALLPEGRGRLDAVGDLVAHVTPTGWARRPGIGIVALDYDTGHRAVFGRPGSPEADLPRAVMASCAIPMWYEPVVIEGDRYVDGGVWSSTNLDLMTGLDLDEVYVLAPMVSFVKWTPKPLGDRIAQRWRYRVTLRCLRELEKVRSEGTKVTVLGPGEEDLVAIGNNPMDVARRPGVVETSVRTSRAALENPILLPEPIHFEDVG
jgi:NTE family protein